MTSPLTRVMDDFIAEIEIEASFSTKNKYFFQPATFHINSMINFHLDVRKSEARKKLI